MIRYSGGRSTRLKRRCRVPNMCATVTAADVYLSSGIGFGMQFGVIEKRPAFERHCQRLSARPAALRAKEIDDALSA